MYIDENITKDTTSDEFKSWLTDQLANQVLQVTFLKQDGSRRTMKCTINKDVIPAPLVPRRNPDVMTVFDLDVGDWRSFRFDRLQEIVSV